MIGPITCVTIAAPDLGAMEEAYKHLGYRATAGGRIPGERAAFWGAEAAEGAQFLLMAPETSEGFHFRFVEQPAAPGYEAYHFVDRTFIMILGGPSVEMLAEGWGKRFGIPASEPRPVKITVMAQAYGLPTSHRFMLSTMPLEGSNLIELDSMPETATPRPQLEGWLPPSISMVSFACDDLGAQTLTGQAGAPYHGRAASMWRGPVGEWVELIAP